jgi:hypothetical protein
VLQFALKDSIQARTLKLECVFNARYGIMSSASHLEYKHSWINKCDRSIAKWFSTWMASSSRTLEFILNLIPYSQHIYHSINGMCDDQQEGGPRPQISQGRPFHRQI